jgi:DNA-binding NarL/FixJ family response regulator
VSALRVLIVDPQTLFRAALVRLLDDDERVKVVGEARDGLEAIEKVSSLKPDIVLMDIRMPNLDGIEATRQIVATHPDLKVLILTSFEADSYVIQALKAGASGYMLKDSQADAVVSSILAVAAGKQVMSGRVVSRVLEMVTRTIKPTEFHDGLTRREIEILKMLASGMGDRQIAYKLRLRHKTIRNHVSNLYRKLQISDRSQAVLYAMRKGLIDARHQIRR